MTKPSINTAQDQEGNSATHCKELLQVQRDGLITQEQQHKQGFETGKQNIREFLVMSLELLYAPILANETQGIHQVI